MAEEISYSTAMDVNMSWDSLKRKAGYPEKAGELLLMKLVETEPKIRDVFKLGSGDIKAAPSFRTHTGALCDMLDCAVDFLGPDLDALGEELKHLGKRHYQYGVKPEFLPHMIDAVLHMMKEILGSKFHDDDKKAWKEVLSFMISKMQEDMKD